MTIFGIPLNAIASQIALGAVTGATYAALSLGLAVIFGLLRVINFAHGSFYMVGAMAAWGLLNYLGVGYFPALILSPIIVGCIGAALERFGLRRLYSEDPLYGFLFTLGFSLVLEGVLRQCYGSSGVPYNAPEMFQGVVDIGFMMMPKYRLVAIGACLSASLGVWLAIEKTKLGQKLRAASENPKLTQALGINVPRMMTLTFAAGSALAGLAGVLAAPATQVSPLMGAELITPVFAVVVTGGMGSIGGSIAAGLLLGCAEALCRVFFPEAAPTVVYIVMVVVLMFKPAGLFGKEI